MAQPRRSGRLIEQKQREPESAFDDGVIRWMKAPIEKDVDLEKVDMTWNSVCAAFPWYHADHAEEIVAFMNMNNVIHLRNHDIMRIAVCEANNAMLRWRAAREERASQFEEEMNQWASQFQEEMHQWIRQARLALFLAARKLKPRSTPWRQFTKTGDEGAYATTQKEIVERLERGILECFRDSNESVVSAELDALLSGCLCWGSLASIIDPQSIDAFAASFFDILKPTGARVRCAAIAIRIFESIYTDAVTKDERDAKEAYPVERFEHYGCQMIDAETRRRVRVLPQFEWRGQIFRGAVWHGIVTCSYGKWSVAEFDVDEIGDADAKGFAERAAAQAPPPRTSVFEKIAAFSERVGVAFERHQFVSACYESALNAHLRVFAPSVIAAMHCVEMDGSPIPEDELLNGGNHLESIWPNDCDRALRVQLCIARRGGSCGSRHKRSLFDRRSRILWQHPRQAHDRLRLAGGPGGRWRRIQDIAHENRPDATPRGRYRTSRKRFHRFPLDACGKSELFARHVDARYRPLDRARPRGAQTKRNQASRNKKHRILGDYRRTRTSDRN